MSETKPTAVTDEVAGEWLGCRVLLEIKRPVPVVELAAISEALTRLHGKGLLMRQEGPYLQICKPK